MNSGAERDFLIGRGPTGLIHDNTQLAKNAIAYACAKPRIILILIK